MLSSHCTSCTCTMSEQLFVQTDLWDEIYNLCLESVSFVLGVYESTWLLYFFALCTGLNTDIVYMQGFSITLPPELQEECIHNVRGLEKAVMTRPGKACNLSQK